MLFEFCGVGVDNYHFAFSTENSLDFLQALYGNLEK
jgi:hypothetical protein